MPSWLTVEFLRDLLQPSGEIELKSIQNACKAGENFASKIYRVKIIFKGHIQSLIVKSRPFGNNRAFSEEFIEKFNVFPKEIDAYKLIENFENILKSSIKAPASFRFAPK
jgi:hypothetical protein